MGTPNKQKWSEIDKLPDFHKIQFKQVSGKLWTDILPGCQNEVIDLAEMIFNYDPTQRIQAKKVCPIWFFF